MVSEASVLAIIPARGGSKSIQHKNRRLFAGHPLLAYSIAAGRQAATVERVIVSTDDEAIARLSREYGAEVPFLRPSELAQDDTPDLPVFQHALGWLQAEEGYRPDIVVQLRPTSPVRPPDCVDQAVGKLLKDPSADSVRGVVPSGQNPYKMWRMDAQGALQPLLTAELPEPYNQPRQRLPQTYWQTGHIDAIRIATILEKGSMSGERILALLLPPEYAIDIDTPRDWARAESLVRRIDLPMVRPGGPPRPLPEAVELLILDFDGVLTDDRVWVDQGGSESVAASRSDGWGIARLRERGVEVLVLSTEANPVVAARCRKLGIACMQGIGDKAAALEQVLAERKLDRERTIYLGNDVNDLPCFPLVGCAIVVADAHPQALARADLVLERRGGHGAVRELTDMLIQRMSDRESNES